MLIGPLNSLSSKHGIHKFPQNSAPSIFPTHSQQTLISFSPQWWCSGTQSSSSVNQMVCWGRKIQQKSRQLCAVRKKKVKLCTNDGFFYYKPCNDLLLVKAIFHHNIDNNFNHCQIKWQTKTFKKGL